jgi:hypothetical protein
MLARVTKALRAKAAIALALIYAFCVLAPPAAFAFSHDPDVARCLIEGHVGIAVHDHGKMHMHADGTAHHHHDPHAPQKQPDPSGQLPNCCSLFSLVAIPEAVGSVPEMFGHASIVLPALANVLTGRGPDRIDRPPIA